MKNSRALIKLKRYSLLALMLFFIAGCGGGAGPATGTPPVPKVPATHPINRVPSAAIAPIDSIKGVVPNWSGDAAFAVLVLPEGIGGIRVLTSSPISAEGSFSLTLPSSVPSELLTDYQEESCWPTVPNIVFPFLIVSPLTNPQTDADLSGRLGLEGYLEGGNIKPRVGWVYSQRAGTYQGSCEYERTAQQPNEIWQLDLRLVAGWNSFVQTEVEGDPEFELYQTKPVPAGVEWIYRAP